MRVLTFVGNYLPGYKSGGPVRTVANMVAHLGDEFNIKIITSDRDFLEKYPYPDIFVNAWNKVGHADVYYISPEKKTLYHLSHVLQNTEYEVLYLNSFFDFDFTIKPLILRRLGLIPDKPVVIAPRGEFSQGALSLKSLKKKIYLALANFFGLYKGLYWQASSEHEVDDIKQVLGRQVQNIMVAPDLPSAPPEQVINMRLPAPSPDAPLKIIYISRITPKKNLDFALHVLAHMKVPVLFDLFGVVDDDAYWSKCKEIIKELPEHIKVENMGSIPHQEVFETFARYDLFFFPTRGENYGHVIYESLAAGTPALISDQTPWRDFEKKGVGWVYPLDDMKYFIECIERFYHMDSEKINLMRARAYEYASAVSKDSDTLAANKALFLKAYGRKDVIEE